MKVEAMTLEQLKEMLTAVENLDLRPRRNGHMIRHLDECAAIPTMLDGFESAGGECDCGMAELWMARMAVKEGL